MKKLFLFLLVSVLAFGANAQFGRAYTIPLALGDTVVNTGTAAKVITITGNYAGTAIEVYLTKLSGTNGGTVGLYGSNDGTNYTLIDTAYTITTATTQSVMFYRAAPLPVYLKILATGTGTMSTVLTVKYVIRKYS